MNACGQLIPFAHSKIICGCQEVLRFSLDVGPIQVQMLLRSPPIPSCYLCKVLVHKDDTCMGFQGHFIIKTASSLQVLMSRLKQLS